MTKNISSQTSDLVLEGFKLAWFLSAFLHKLDHMHLEIRKIARANPEKVAIRSGEISLTYKELEEKSNQLANLLLESGLNQGDTVGIYLDQSHLIPIAVLGVLKAGGTYVPLSLDYPQGRIEEIGNQACFKFLLTEKELPVSGIRSEPQCFVFNGTMEILATISSEYFPVDVANDQAAYIMFTSGSTGAPKGVIIEHRSLSSYMEWVLLDLYGATEVNLPLTSSFCFAASVAQMFLPLLLGETLHIVERKIVKNPVSLIDWYQSHAELGLYCVPSLWEEIVRYVENSDQQWESPRCVYLSGEALPKHLVERTYALWPEIIVWNLYGPTEATANISATEVAKEGGVHLGSAIRGGHLILLDNQMEEVPKGADGTIFIASRALARGYLGNEELNRECFVREHNLEKYKGLTLYNTGDRGRFNENGELLFLGRKDQQVKIRGHRIEIDEVSHAIGALSFVQQAICKVDGEGHEARIVAFVVTDKKIHTDGILHHLRKKLPEYMLPQQIVFLESLPRLSNGKIDRKQLIVSKERPSLSYSHIAGLRDDEKCLLEIWERVLDLENLGMCDNFFDLGGSSLKMVQLAHDIEKSFCCALGIDEIWDNPTPEKLLGLLNSKEEFKAPEKEMAVQRPENDSNPQSPLTFNQSALWFIHHSRPDQSAYNMLFTIEFYDSVMSCEQIKQRLQAIVVDNDILRSNFRVEKKVPVRFVHTREIDLTVIPVLEDVAIDIIHDDIKERAFTKRYDLERDNLITFTLVEQGAFRRLYVAVHHIVFDGVSIKLFLEKLKGDKASKWRYSDFEKGWRKEYFSGKMEKDYTYWRKTLEGANFFLNFPTDYIRPQVQSYEGEIYTFRLDRERVRKLNRFCSEHNTTKFVTLLSVFYVMLHKYTREEDIMVGVPFANRTSPEAKDVIGFYTNTVVYRQLIKGDLAFSELCESLGEYTKKALAHQRFPFDKLVEKLNPERSVSANPIFQVMFAYHGDINENSRQSNSNLTAAEILNPACKFDLDLEVQEESDSIALHLNYNTSLFTEETARIFLEQFVTVLEQVIDAPAKETHHISLFSSAEEREECASIYGPQIHFEDSLLHEDLEIQARVHPNKCAISINNETITYTELDKKANQFAHYLRAFGVASNVPVAIVAERSIEMMVVLFGILKSGAAYLPLDPRHPMERIDKILSESKAGIVVDLCGKLKESNRLQIVTLKEREHWESLSTEKCQVDIADTDIAYIIYTSGTTNTPKGVMISHAAIANRLDWMQRAYPITSDDILIQKTAYTFDVSLWELFWWSKTGSELRLLNPEEEKNPEVLTKAIAEKGVTVVHFVPSMLNIFLEYSQNIKQPVSLGLKYIFTSGEALEVHHLEKLQSLGFMDRGTRIINLYGPTEASVDVTHFDISHTKAGQKIPIGKPIQNTGIHILDDENRELPRNVPGELAISGTGLAKGYLNQEQLTSQKFIKSPQLDMRLYKTGDLARILPNGDIEFMGRLDSQVKIRGFRIELGEIESQIMTHPNVANAAVTVKEFTYEDKRLVAYVQMKNSDEQVDVSRYLKNLLPSYMIPSTYQVVDSLPLTSSGKLDTRNLPDPFGDISKVAGEKIFNNEYEVRLSKIWTQVLKTDNFSLQDNFYDVGGHSLLLISMKALIDKEFGVDIPIMELFQYSSIESFAEVLIRRNKVSKVSRISSRANMQRMSILRNRKVKN